LLSKTSWKSLDENNLKEFSEVCHMNFRSLQDKLQKFTSSTSIVRKHNIKEIQKKGELSLEKSLTFGENRYGKMKMEKICYLGPQ